MKNSNKQNFQKLEQKLRTAQEQIVRLEAEIEWMKSSKFWKLRELLLKIKPKLPWGNSHHQYEALNSVEKTQVPSINYELPQSLPGRSLSVLLVVEEAIDHCFRYRVHQKIEQLQLLGYQTNWVSWKQPQRARELLQFHHLVIFYRVPAFNEVVATIKMAKALNRIVIFDIDDLIFLPQWYPEPFEKYEKQLSYDEYRGLVEGGQLYQEALSHCDFAIASTPSLQKFMEQVIGEGNAFCHRNCLDQTILEFVNDPPRQCSRDYLSIFYGSGTKTHDADFSLIAPALANLLSKYPQLRLTIIGHITLPPSLTSYSSRIDRVPFLSSAEAYWQFFAQADINVAPLTGGQFNDCKSEIKWLEAAVFGIPSVVSATSTYAEILEDGNHGFLARNLREWEEKLEALIVDDSRRSAIGKQARQKALNDYSPATVANQLNATFNQTIELAADKGIVTRQPQKMRLLCVNVLYPPQGHGGATGLLKNILDCLQTNYRESYDLFVFTLDWQNSNAYEIKTETIDGVYVTRISIPPKANEDWHYQDATVYERFCEYLQTIQPDFIHFHCVQRLTASTLEAAADVGIPYFVTFHDAWWLGDCQFLVDENGQPCDTRLNDPLITARYSRNISLTLKRQRYLATQLKKAQKLLAVSHTQAQLYRKNGFEETIVNRNGIPAITKPNSQPPSKNEIRLGYAGGICTHKGYYLLKTAIEQANLQNTTLTVIDLFTSLGAPRWEKWGTTPVQFIPKLPTEEMGEFYGNIDVLVAPSIWPESFGLITREATLAGVWVVASNAGALAEDIEPGIHGDIFSPDKPEELVQILQKLDRDPQAYQQAIPREKTTHIRTLSEQVEELHKLYQKLTNSRSRRWNLTPG